MSLKSRMLARAGSRVPIGCELIGATVATACLAALAFAPAAEAATTTLTGTVSGGGLSNTAPTIAPFSATLNGATQTVHTTVGAWSVTDATGSGAGYEITVSATAPVISDSTSGSPSAGTGFALELTPPTATAATGNPATTGPVATSTQTLESSATTIENAAEGAGQGEWDFPADSGETKSLAIVIPANASVGEYSSTLTFTTSPPAS